MKYKGIFIIISMLLSQLILGQTNESKRANNWYFGENCGINFSSGIPNYVLNGQINTLEGCSSISDTSGNLLFYTDGISVWDSTHTQMPNGFGLHGDFSSMNSALIVPKPLDSNIYYIFTTPSTGSVFSGFKYFEYSIVDITLNNGLGDVTEKGVELFSRSTEQLGGIQHCNKQDYWVVTHQDSSSNFRTYLINENGVDTTSVISNAGIYIPPYSAACWSCYVGDLVISPTGNKIAITIPVKDTLELFDFDNNTGLLSNPISLNLPDASGVCFSPDGTKLYVNHTSNATYRLSQFDATSNSVSELTGSQNMITNEALYGTQMQIGPDGKIYLTNLDEEYLSVINYPNLDAVNCSYNSNEVDLGGRRNFYGLPNFIQSYFSNDSGPIDCFSTSIEHVDDISVGIYPNPFSTQTTIQIKGYDLLAATIKIYAMDGSMKSEINNVSQNIIHISEMKLENGFYIFQIIEDGKLFHTGKLIVID